MSRHHHHHHHHRLNGGDLGESDDVKQDLLDLAEHLRQESLYIKNEKSQVSSSNCHQ